MTNNNIKGNKFELEVLKKLESDGYLCMRAPRTARYVGAGRYISGSNDFFNLFDIVAKKGNKTLWIQCKYGSKKNIYDKRSQMEMFYHKNCSHLEKVQVWFRAPRKAIEIYEYQDTSLFLITNTQYDWVKQ